jgi:uncharacterized protein (DUF2384 family)
MAKPPSRRSNADSTNRKSASRASLRTKAKARAKAVGRRSTTAPAFVEGHGRAARQNAPERTVVSRRPEPSGAALLRQFLNEEGKIVPDRVADWFGMSKGQLGETIGVSAATLHRFSREYAPTTQSRLREMLEVLGRVADWAGGVKQAMAWYRAEPIPSFGGRTAEFLVKEGKAEAVRNYLDRVALGGFA